MHFYEIEFNNFKMVSLILEFSKKFLLPNHKEFLLYFCPEDLAFTFRLMLLLKLIFVYGLRGDSFIFPFGLVTPARLVQSTLLFPLNYVSVLNKRYWPYRQELYLDFFIVCRELCVYALLSSHSLDYLIVNFIASLEIMHLHVLFFKMVIAISDPLNSI